MSKISSYNKLKQKIKELETENAIKLSHIRTLLEGNKLQPDVALNYRFIFDSDDLIWKGAVEFRSIEQFDGLLKKLNP